MIGVAKRVARVGFGERDERDDVTGASLFVVVLAVTGAVPDAITVRVQRPARRGRPSVDRSTRATRAAATSLPPGITAGKTSGKHSTARVSRASSPLG